MTSRQRFHKTMHYGSPDRVPYFEEGIREEVIKVWQKQGLSGNITHRFQSDKFYEIDLDPFADIHNYPASYDELSEFRDRLDSTLLIQLEFQWEKLKRKLIKKDSVLFLKVHRGFFLSMGVYYWDRFMEVINMLAEDPEFVSQLLLIQSEIITKILNRILTELDIDAVIFSEPIGGNEGPLISPEMYDRYVLTAYDPVIQCLKKNQIDIIIMRTYANIRLLIPMILHHGINCLWACETNSPAMDYREIRKEFGRRLRFIGGIDLDALRYGKEAIRNEIESRVPELIADGGYIPLADGRVRSDIPYDNYLFYRRLLEKIIHGKNG